VSTRAGGAPEAPARPSPRGRTRNAWDAVGVVLCCVSAVLAAIIAVLLTPLYWGDVLTPAAVLLAGVTNVVLPALGRRLGGSGMYAVLPFAAWLITVLVLSVARPEGDVLLPGGGGAQPWVTYGMLLAGGVAGGLTIIVPGMAAGRPGADGSR
jgi:hypothetical protein